MAMLLGVPNSSYIDLTNIAGYGYTFDKTFDKMFHTEILIRISAYTWSIAHQGQIHTFKNSYITN